MSEEPKKITLGDTVKWTKSFSLFKASEGWVLSYYLNGPKAENFQASADGDAFSIELSASTTANWQPGRYSWASRIALGTEVYTLESGIMILCANPALIPSGYDSRSHNRKALDAINATIEGRANQEELNYSISDGGMTQSVGLTPLADLIRLKSYYENLVALEEQAEALESGINVGGRIKTRFL